MMGRHLRLIFFFAAALAAAATPAQGQTPPATFGVNFTTLRTSTPLSAVERQFYSGFGVELTARLHGRWGVDGEADFLAPFAAAWLQETLIGVRYRAAQGRRWAFYLNARPGWLYLNNEFGPFSQTFNFALGLGGTAEFRLPGRWLWRVRAGDLLIPGSNALLPANNFQFSTGLAFRF